MQPESTLPDDSRTLTEDELKASLPLALKDKVRIRLEKQAGGVVAVRITKYNPKNAARGEGSRDSAQTP